jgi:hypothetical protein
MPAVQPVPPVPAVQPVARRAPAWLGATSSKAPAAVAFADVLAACLGYTPIAAASPSSAAPADAATPSFLFDHVERRPGVPAGGETRRERRPFSAVASAYRVQTTPACLRLLGLHLPCTETAVRQAYRQQARALHPDAGGDPRAFVALRTAYEEALRLAAPEAA